MSGQPSDYSHPNAVHESVPHPSAQPQTNPTYPPGYTHPPPPYQPPPPYSQPHPGYAPQHPAYPPQSVGYPQPAAQPHTNVVVVGGVQPTQTVVERPRVNHVLHMIITFFFWPWVFVWLFLCFQEGIIS